MIALQVLHWLKETFKDADIGSMIQLTERVSLKTSEKELCRITETDFAFQMIRYEDGAFISQNVDTWRQSFISHFGQSVRKFHAEHSDIYLGSKDATKKRVSFLLTISLFQKERIEAQSAE